MGLDKIQPSSRDHVVTYARIVVGYQSQRKRPKSCKNNSGGNLINYPFELTTCTVDITTSKVMWNLTASTHNTQYMCVYKGTFYLATAKNQPEYMRIPVELVQQEFVDANNVPSKIKNGCIYMKVVRLAISHANFEYGCRWQVQPPRTHQRKSHSLSSLKHASCHPPTHPPTQPTLMTPHV